MSWATRLGQWVKWGWFAAASTAWVTASARSFHTLAINNMGHVDIRVTHVVPHNLGPCAFAQHMAGMRGAEASKHPLLLESEESESLQMLFANIHG